MKAINHGLLAGCPPPSIPLLNEWLDAHGVERSDGVRVAPMADGSGWRVLATRDLEIGETICKIPKSALLSLRTTSLPPLTPAAVDTHTTSHTILGLALALLHELRLGPESEFWGYIQSLPRDTVPIPVLWPLDCEGSDARKAYEWLKGTEAERDLHRREAEGVGLDQARQFYAATAACLPPTKAHPEPSPFEAFAHACSLVSTRAFVIDLYHTIALCPFADLLNHSAVSHTSLASDDFVCHRCGSLAQCEHDVCRPGENVPLRLEHLSEIECQRISNENDTVDMYVELPVRAGREVMNSYGDGIGEARLLVEWGFVPGFRPRTAYANGNGNADEEEEEEDEEDEEDGGDDNFVGDGLTWNLEELVPPVLATAWRAMGEGGTVGFFGTDDDDNDPEASLLCSPSPRGTYHLNHAGQVSVRIFGALYLAATVRAKLKLGDDVLRQPVVEVELDDALDLDSDDVLNDLLADINHLEATWSQEQEGEPVPPLKGVLLDTVLAVRELIQKRIDGLGDKSLGQVYDLREALPAESRLQAMAMTIVINELALLTSALERWDELLQSTTEQVQVAI